MAKLISNKDGNSYTFGSFTAQSPNTYRVVQDGEVVGHVEKIVYNLANLNPAWGGHRPCWALFNSDGKIVSVSQDFSDIRSYAKAL